MSRGPLSEGTRDLEKSFEQEQHDQMDRRARSFQTQYIKRDWDGMRREARFLVVRWMQQPRKERTVPGPGHGGMGEFRSCLELRMPSDV